MRSRMKFDFLTLENVGALLYTEEFLNWGSQCNDILKSKNKTIVSQVARDVKYMVESLKIFEDTFVRMTMILDNDWPVIHLQFSSRERVIDCWLDFNALHVGANKVIRNVKINGRITLASVSVSDTINYFLTRG